MTKRIAFTKMHGAGNDYIYVDTSAYSLECPERVAVEWSNRHTGIGSDGLVLIGRSPVPEADFTMRIFNADGSEAKMCGNASRCIGKYVYERGLTTQTTVRLLTLSGVKLLQLHVDEKTGQVETVTVDMGTPRPQLLAETDACSVDMGNPHYVVFVDDISAVDVQAEGSRLECQPLFPERCNVEFAELRPDGIRVRVWERGSGITMACGTGACATAVAACITGRAGHHSSIVMDGGTLDIEWRETDNHVYMTGPAAFVFDGEIDLVD